MTPHHKGILLTLSASAGAACFLTVYKVASKLGDPSDAVLWMLGSAALFNSVTSVVGTRGRRILHLDRLSILLSVSLAALTLLGNHLALQALSRISAPLTSVMQQTQVLFVAVLGLVLLGEGVTARFWVGTGIAALGLCILNWSPGSAGGHSALGTALAVGSAACFSAMAVLTRKFIHRIHPIPVNALRLWISVAIWFLLERRLPHPGNVEFVVYCALAAAFGPFLSRTALMYALKYAPAGQTTLVGLVTPVVALVPSFIVFGTVPGPREWIGSAVMISGIAVPLLEARARTIAVPAAE